MADDLTPYQREVLRLRLDGYSIEATALRLGRTAKNINAITKRLREKGHRIPRGWRGLKESQTHVANTYLTDQRKACRKAEDKWQAAFDAEGRDYAGLRVQQTAE